MGLFNPFTWFGSKAQTDPEKYTEATVSVWDHANQFQGKPWPFDYTAVMVQLSSWAYRCVAGNAERAAAADLRLYVRGRRTGYKVTSHRFPGKKLIYESRKVNASTARYLKGRNEHNPSRAVRSKVMSFGDDFQEVTEHPIIDLLRDVNPSHDMNGFDFSVLRFMCMELTGNFYVHPVMQKIEDGLPVPSQLWPMMPQYVRVIPADPGSDTLVEGYRYGTDGPNGPNSVVFDADEVGHFKSPNPRDTYYGLGKAEPAWSVLHLHHEKRRSDIAFFENNARPDYLLVAKPGTPENQLKRFESRIKTMLRGSRNASKFLAITGDITATPMQFSPKDLGDQAEVLEEIAGIFGYPITKLKANDPNRANAQTGDAGWLADTIMPMLRKDEEMLNSWLLPLFGEEFAANAVLAYDDVMPRNRLEDRADATTGFATGTTSINERREEMGLGLIDDANADLPLVPQGLTTVDKIGEAPASPFGFPMPGPPKAISPQRPEHAGNEKDVSIPFQSLDPKQWAKEATELVLKMVKDATESGIMGYGNHGLHNRTAPDDPGAIHGDADNPGGAGFGDDSDGRLGDLAGKTRYHPDGRADDLATGGIRPKAGQPPLDPSPRRFSIPTAIVKATNNARMSLMLKDALAAQVINVDVPAPQVTVNMSDAPVKIMGKVPAVTLDKPLAVVSSVDIPRAKRTVKVARGKRDELTGGEIG
jgi:HK97 family phage portal protein